MLSIKCLTTSHALPTVQMKIIYDAYGVLISETKKLQCMNAKI